MTWPTRWTMYLGPSVPADLINYVTYPERRFGTEEGANTFVDAIKGKAVLVNYNPRDPATSDPPESALLAVLPDKAMLGKRS